MRLTQRGRRLVVGLLALLLVGCSPIPTPTETMRPVQSPADWAQAGASESLAATALQPDLRWHADVPGRAHRLWWQGGTLLVSSLPSALNSADDRSLSAFDLQGSLRWQRDLQPARLLDADLDQAGNAYLIVGGPQPTGAILSLTPTGQQRWTSPWDAGWPRSLRVSQDGRRTVVGFDGKSGAFLGRLRVLGPDGKPARPDTAAPLNGFAGIPSGDGRTLLMGYEGTDPGIFANEPSRGIGVRLLDDQGDALWSIINYHRPLALNQDGTLAVVAGVPASDRAYDPPQQDNQPAPPFGQLLWLNRAGVIVGRYRFPFAAGIRAFRMTPDGSACAIALISYRFAGEPHPVTQQHVAWLKADGQVAWDRPLTEDLVDIGLADGGSGLLLAQHPADGSGDWLTLHDASGAIVWRYHHSAPVQAVALSPDGSTAAVLATNGLWFFATKLKG